MRELVITISLVSRMVSEWLSRSCTRPSAQSITGWVYTYLVWSRALSRHFTSYVYSRRNPSNETLNGRWPSTSIDIFYPGGAAKSCIMHECAGYSYPSNRNTAMLICGEKRKGEVPSHAALTGWSQPTTSKILPHGFEPRNMKLPLFHCATTVVYQYKNLLILGW